MTYKEFCKHVVTTLALDNRAIMFTILEMDGTYVGPGMVDSTNDLYDFDPFIEAALDRCDEETLYVESVASYVVGDGEVDRAEYGDIDFIIQCMDKYPDFTDKFIREECDELCGYADVDVENPEYEDPDCDYDEDDE